MVTSDSTESEIKYNSFVFSDTLKGDITESGDVVLAIVNVNI